jgi:hypothetical protein
MTQSHDPSRPHTVTLDAKSVRVLSKPRPDQERPSNVFGPFNLGGYLGIFRDPIGPGQDVEVAIYLQGIIIGAPWTVTASVTEWSNTLAAPWSGAARFLTRRVAFDQEDGQPVGVGFQMDWGSPLPVAVMLTIGTM